MASSTPNRSLVGRAAAILTNSEVAGAALDINETWGARVTVDLSFTLGSLTNIILAAYVSMDGVTYDPIAVEATGVAWTRTETGSVERCYTFSNLAGWKWFRMAVTGTGTLTSSTCNYVYRYLRRGSQ